MHQLLLDGRWMIQVDIVLIERKNDRFVHASLSSLTRSSDIHQIGAQRFLRLIHRPEIQK